MVGSTRETLLETAEQRAVRPIMCTKALIKLSFGIVATAARAHIDVAVGPYQFGASKPDKALACLDGKNAVGSIHWHQALLVRLASAPKLAAPLRLP